VKADALGGVYGSQVLNRSAILTIAALLLVACSRTEPCTRVATVDDATVVASKFVRAQGYTAADPVISEFRCESQESCGDRDLALLRRRNVLLSEPSGYSTEAYGWRVFFPYSAPPVPSHARVVHVGRCAEATYLEHESLPRSAAETIL